ncbi:MAG: recombination-associated protein RdgC [Desulfovibrionaceae bacterium]|nr:recombination-associated protein RdgC [Desulfovibrionaceae bacterium]
MSGFFTSTTAMRIYSVSGSVGEFGDRLTNAAFRSQPKEVDPQEKIIGFVGLGDALDTDFQFDIQHENYITLSLRIDERKPSMPAVRIRFAEALKKEAENNGKVSRERKKELKEDALFAVLMKSDYVPTLVDIIYDTEKQRLVLSTASEAQAALATELFSRVFGVTLEAITASEDIKDVFRTIYMGEKSVAVELEDGSGALLLSDDFTVTLQTQESSDERASVSARGNQEAGLKALEEGLYIRRMGINAEVRDPEEQSDDPKATCQFMLDESLIVTGLKMPKQERGSAREDDFFLKAGHAFLVAEIVEKMGAISV